MSNATCSVDGCDRQAKCKGYCLAHYSRVRRLGSPGEAQIQRRNPGALCAIDDCDRPLGKSGAHGYCQKHVYRLRSNGDALATRPPGSPAGPNHPKYRGDDVGYAAVHRRLRLQLGRAADHECATCGSGAHGWAYQHTAPDERTCEVTGLPFSTDLSHYRPLCYSCHAKLDQSFGYRVSNRRGASLVKRTGKWRAYAWKNGRQFHGGYFATEQEAIAAAARLRDVLLDDWFAAGA